MIGPNTNVKLLRIFDTYFIEGSEIGHPHGSLAINPEINYTTKICAWQDTTAVPKPHQFTEIKPLGQYFDNGIWFVDENGDSWKLIPLTVELFKKHIRGNVPENVLNSDAQLRAWYKEEALGEH